MSNWSFGNATLVTEWNTVHYSADLQCAFFSIEISDDAQINDEPQLALGTFFNFLTKEPI